MGVAVSPIRAISAATGAAPPRGRVHVERYHRGEPIIRPTERGWENGVTFNAAVVHLRPAARDAALIDGLLLAAGVGSDGAAAPVAELVAVYYRARPRTDPGHFMTRSYTGLALFDAQLNPIHRFPDPLIAPDDDPAADDYLGVEDPRITRVGDRFVMVYCGCGEREPGQWRATLCTAESSDLLHWRKLGRIDIRIPGVSGHVDNKDGVLFPTPAQQHRNDDGWHYLLHRPMIGPISQWSIHLARSRALDGAWDDLGPILGAAPLDGWVDAWIGGGAVPMPLDGRRFLEIHHSGHREAAGKRLYTLGAAVLDLGRLDPARPGAIVEARVDHFMVPETRWEIEGPYPDSVGNVLFACGAYERDGQIHILYGGGDTFVMAARVDKQQLLGALEPVHGRAP